MKCGRVTMWLLFISVNVRKSAYNSESKWTHMNASDRQWMQVNANKAKWMKVSVSDCKWKLMSACERMWMQMSWAQTTSEQGLLAIDWNQTSFHRILILVWEQVNYWFKKSKVFRLIDYGKTLLVIRNARLEAWKGDKT